MKKVIIIVCSILLVAMILGFTIVAIKGNWFVKQEDLTDNISKNKYELETKKLELEDLPYNYTLEKAIEDECFVIAKGNKIYNIIYNQSVLEDFIKKTEINAKDRQEASIRIVMLTTEGDIIIKDIIYNNEKYIVKVDNTRDKLSAQEDRKITILEDFPKDIYGIVEIENDDIIEVHLGLYALIDYISPDVKMYEDYFICSYPKNAVNAELYSFYGKVIEANEKSIIVEPNESEDIRKTADKIEVGLGKNNDMIYTVGTNVKITYSGYIMESYPAKVDALKIEIKSAEDFELIFHNKHPEDSYKTYTILDKSETNKYDYTIYGYDGQVNIRISGKDYSLRDALLDNKITMDEIIAKANQDFPNAISYDDGGSIEYHYDNYTIIKFHTIEGNRDVYIGAKGMKIK